MLDSARQKIEICSQNVSTTCSAIKSYSPIFCVANSRKASECGLYRFRRFSLYLLPMETEPQEITAGDHVTWELYLSDYPPSAGWALKYALRGPAAINIVSTPSGLNHKVDVPGNTSKDYMSGAYSWARYVEKLDGTRVTLATGRIKIKPDLITAVAGYDGSSHAERVLAAIERVIEGRASRGDQELWFDGKKITKMTVDELIKLRQYYKQELRTDGKVTKSARRTIKVRFS